MKITHKKTNSQKGLPIKKKLENKKYSAKTTSITTKIN
jgi:hypothetical protein